MAAFGAGAAGILVLLRRKWLRPAILALLFFAIGLAEYAAYYRVTIEQAEMLDGKTLEITGTVLEYPDDYGSYCRLRIRVDEGPLCNKKAVAYDYDRILSETTPGQQIRFTAQARNAGTLYGKPYDNYYVNGWFYKFTIRGNVEILGARFDLRLLPVKMQHWLLNHIEMVFPADTQSFLKALMLGEKQEFYEDDALYVSMSRAGLMHVVAVSGAQYLLLGFYTIARKPVNWALFGHRPRRCTPKLRFT